LSKEELLDAVAAEIIVCPKCRLSRTRKNAVPGEGNPESPIMFIGEAPGYWEDMKGKPFVGAAGKFLNSLILKIGCSRDDVFICNIVKCRPPRNRGPLPDEIQTCTAYLDRQINLIQPKSIVTLGNFSTEYIFSKADLPFNGITRAHGKFRKSLILGLKVTIFPTFHPAAALYSAKYKKQITKDFGLLRDKLRQTKIVKR
jgi:DNA polymerase